MCGKKPKADPRIAEQQAQQRADIAAAKVAERAKVAEEKAAALEEAKAEANRTADTGAAAGRQTETDKVVSAAQTREERVSKFGAEATAGRRGRRSGSRGRRSLITGLGGGIGYFNRFGG
jgi:hypothetical protein